LRAAATVTPEGVELRLQSGALSVLGVRAADSPKSPSTRPTGWRDGHTRDGSMLRDEIEVELESHELGAIRGLRYLDDIMTGVLDSARKLTPLGKSSIAFRS
jgi:hypothetical protein